MQRTIFSLAIIGILSISIAIAHASCIKDGFRGIPWGTSIEDAIKKYGLENVKDNIYIRKNDNLSLGDVPLNNIFYFINTEKKFVGVILRYNDEYFHDIIEELSDNFGQPTLSISTKFEWDLHDIIIKTELNTESIDPFSNIVIHIMTETDRKQQKSSRGGGF